MVLGNMEIGLNTANLTGILIVFLLAIVNIFGVKLGALIQNVFTSAKALSLAGLVLLAFTIGRNATAWSANFGLDSRSSGAMPAGRHSIPSRWESAGR